MFDKIHFDVTLKQLHLSLKYYLAHNSQLAHET